MTAAVPYWVPTSPCGDGCLPADAPGVSSITVMARGVMVGAALVTAACAFGRLAAPAHLAY